MKSVHDNKYNMFIVIFCTLEFLLTVKNVLVVYLILRELICI